jgi:hypothetical protein
MSNYDREQREMDAVQRDLSRGLNLGVIGWTLLLFNGIPFMFVWTGWRAGSMFWTYWALIEGAVGLVFVVMGRRYRARAGREVLPPGEQGEGQQAA